MKLKSKSPFLALTGLLVALPLVAAFSAPSPASVCRFSLLPPAETLDFSDLDARDEFNRPIARPEVRASLERLFVSSLFDSMLNNRTALQKATSSLLSRMWNGRMWWARPLVRWRTSVRAWINNERSRLFVLRLQSSFAVISPVASGAWPANDSFVSLISLLLSSTCLQR